MYDMNYILPDLVAPTSPLSLTPFA